MTVKFEDYEGTDDLIKWKTIEVGSEKREKVFDGEAPAIFALQVQPPFREAAFDVIKDGKVVARLTGDVTSTVVEGTVIEVQSKAFVATNIRFLGPLRRT